jgi:hypothetical protein
MRVNGKTSARGYGWNHQKLRESWSRVVAAGGAVCARCGLPIVPGTPWDLGHVDGSGKTMYQGPEHRGCNRGARPAKRQPEAPFMSGPEQIGGPRRQSRDW